MYLKNALLDMGYFLIFGHKFFGTELNVYIWQFLLLKSQQSRNSSCNLVTARNVVIIE